MSETLMTPAETTNDVGASVAGDAATTVVADATQQQQATQSQTDGQQATEQLPADQQAPQGAPEVYEFKAADGSVLDAQELKAFAEVAKELNLTQEAAQKVIDRMSPAMAARQSAAQEAAAAQWASESQADKEFGGDKLQENLAVAKKGLEQFGTPALRELLNKSGLGNHPEFIRVFYRAGKSISEDKFVTGSVGASPAAGAAKALYPNL